MPAYLVSRRAIRTASALTLTLTVGLATAITLAPTAGAAPAPATAALDQNGWKLFYTATPGQTNKVSVDARLTSDNTAITYVIDDDVPITAGSGCSYPDNSDQTKVSCTLVQGDSQDPEARLKMDLGDKNDTVTYANNTKQVYYYADIYLGTGNDTLTDSGSVDGNNVWGQAGNDTITVGEVSITHAGDGDDKISVSGNYAIALGGKGNDVIHGGAGEQDLMGDNGNDTIYGGAGSDLLHGGKGNDKLYGGKGNDKLYGNSGNDKLYGGPGKDTLSGGSGTDILHQG
jgi:serralysin